MSEENASKVLTVSYGAFSCSLEGFEDSFGMMTAVVDYFRNVSEQDRFFGTEPSKLTPEMLEQLAQVSGEKNIAARQDKDHMVLSAETHVAPEMDTPTAQYAKPAPVKPLTLDERLKRIQEAAAKTKLKTPIVTETDNLDDVEPAQDIRNVMIDEPVASQQQVDPIASDDDIAAAPESDEMVTAENKQSAAIARLAQMVRPTPQIDTPSNEDNTEEAANPQTEDTAPERQGKHHIVSVSDTDVPQSEYLIQGQDSDNAFDTDTDGAMRLTPHDQEDIETDPDTQATNAIPQSEDPQPEEEMSLRVSENTNAIAPKRPQLPKNHKSRGAETLAKPSSDMFRLLNEAKEQMDEPETHRKRNALAHLRAAVAATLADKSILKSKETSNEVDAAPAMPVRPKRPTKTAVAKGNEVPTTPLVLEMSQRVDIDQPAPQGDQANHA